MKTVTREVKTVVNVQIFERGDLIVYRRKDHNANQYGLVLKDQDPNDPTQVKVRDLKHCRDTVWFDVNVETAEYGKCQFVMHLDDVMIDVDNGNGITIVFR